MPQMATCFSQPRHSPCDPSSTHLQRARRFNFFPTGRPPEIAPHLNGHGRLRILHTVNYPIKNLRNSKFLRRKYQNDSSLRNTNLTWTWNPMTIHTKPCRVICTIWMESYSWLEATNSASKNEKQIDTNRNLKIKANRTYNYLNRIKRTNITK